MSLNMYERETVINYNETGEPVEILTYSVKLKNKLARFAAAYPDLCHLVRETAEGGAEYQVQKDRFSVRLKAPLTEAQKEAQKKAAAASAGRLAEYRRKAASDTPAENGGPFSLPAVDLQE